jgi:hypothetical protein
MGPRATKESADIEHVYITPDSAFSHVLVNFGEKDVFLAVIVDNLAKAVHGYYRLNLRQEASDIRRLSLGAPGDEREVGARSGIPLEGPSRAADPCPGKPL